MLAKPKRLKVITLSDDTVQVTFKIPLKGLALGKPSLDVVKMGNIQYRIKYRDSQNKKQKRYAIDTKEVCFNMYGEEVKLRSVDNTLGLVVITSSFVVSINGVVVIGASTPKKIFLQQIVDDKLKLYWFRDVTVARIGSTQFLDEDLDDRERYIFKKGDDAFFMPKALRFRKSMAEYLSDCPEIVSKIEKKEYSKFYWTQVKKLATDYNTICK